jgi:hypothetical protein
MNQKRNYAILLIVLLSFIPLTQLTFPNTAKANFCFPPTNPVITFKSPVNTTFSTNNVTFTVEFYTYKTGYIGAPENESLRHFLYSVDDAEFQTIEITNSSIGLNPGTDVYFDGLINLHDLSQGYHTLTVRVVFDYDQYPPDPFNTHTENTAYAYFIIDSIPDAANTNSFGMPPFLLVASLLAVIAIVAISVLMYYTRFKR